MHERDNQVERGKHAVRASDAHSDTCSARLTAREALSLSLSLANMCVCVCVCVCDQLSCFAFATACSEPFEVLHTRDRGLTLLCDVGHDDDQDDNHLKHMGREGAIGVAHSHAARQSHA
jgi:hypothetical protein